MTEGQIYFAQSDDLIKIGYSIDPASRMWTIPPPNGGWIKLLGTMPGTQENERAIHRQFHAHRVDGEWFRTHSEILDFIETYTSPSLISVPARKLARQDTVMLVVAIDREVRQQFKMIALRKGKTVQAVVRGLVDSYIKENKGLIQ